MLRLKQDLPGKRLSLENADKPHLSVKGRMGCFAFMLLIVIVSAVLGYVLSDNSVQVVAIISVITITVTLLFSGVLVFPRKEILTINADNDKKQLEIALGLPGHAPSRNHVIAFKDVEKVRFTVPHGMGRDNPQNTPFDFCVQSSRLKLVKKISVSKINTDLELLDFLLRFADIIQLRYYRVVVNDPQNFEISSTRATEKRSQPVPKIVEPANYKKGIVAASVPPPPQVVAADSEGEKTLPPTLKALVWEPGLKVKIVKRWRLSDFFVLSAGILAVAGAVILWIRPELLQTFLQTNEKQGIFINSLLFPLFSVGVALTGWILSSARYCCLLDFKTGQAWIRLRGGWNKFNLADVKEVVLDQGKKSSTSSNLPFHEQMGQGQKITVHRIIAKLHNGAFYRLMIDRYSYGLDHFNQHYKELWPFTSSLAELLDVPARYDG